MFPEYSVRVMLDKIQPHSVIKVEPLSVDDDNNDESWNPWEYGEIAQLPFVPKIEPVSVGENNDDESWGHWEFGADDSDEEHLPGQDPLNNEVTPGKFVEVKIESKEGDNCDLITQIVKFLQTLRKRTSKLEVVRLIDLQVSRPRTITTNIKC